MQLALRSTARRLTLFVLLLLSIRLLLAQDGQWLAQQNSKALECLNSRDYAGVQAILLQADTANLPMDSTLAVSYFLLGRSADFLGQAQAGIAWHQKALAWRQENLGSGHRQTLLSLEGLGDIHRYTLNQPYPAIGYYQQALALAEQGHHTDDQRTLTYSLASCYRLIKDVEQAIVYALRSLSLAQNQTNLSGRILASTHNLLANVYHTANGSEEARQHYLQAIALLKKDEGSQPDLRRLRYQNNLVDVYRTLGELEEALRLQQETLISLKKYFPKHELLSTGHYSLARVLADLGNLEEAGNHFSQAIHLRKKGESGLALAEVYRRWGACLIPYQPQQAHQLLDSALAILWPQPQGEITALLPTTDFEALFVTLGHLGRTEVQLKRPQAALDYYQKALQVYQYHRSDYLQEGSILVQAEQHHWLIDEALSLAYDLYAEAPAEELASMVWEWMELGRAVLWQDAYQRHGWLTSSPQASRGRALQYAWEDQKRLAQRGDSAEIAQLYHTQRAWVAWKDSVAAQQPRHQQGAEHVNFTKWRDFQADLGPNEQVISIWEGKTEWYLLLGKRSQIHLHQVPKSPALQGQIAVVNRFARSPIPETLGLEEAEAYGKAAYAIYQAFFGSSLDLATHLLIIPDGRLESFPFEALLTKPIGIPSLAYHTYPYLIHQASIQYGFSGTHLHGAERTAEPARYLGMGWSDGHTSSSGPWPDLPATHQEIRQAAREWRGATYFGAEASKDRFWSAAPSATLLHLALHGVTESDSYHEPALIFPATDSVHYLPWHQLYGLKLNARLTILSACETAAGEVAPGEGMLSMARAFAYAGAQTLVCTQWRLHDQAAMALFSGLHEGMRDGLPADEALRRSKLNYLQNANALEAHPSRWAGVVAIGPEVHFAVSPKPTGYIFLTALLVISLIAGLVYRKLRL